MDSKTTKFFLDRIEGDFGIVLSSDGSAMDIPLTMLPDGIREGVAITATYAVDEGETRDAHDRVAALMAELRAGSDE